jgi:hypothetical protein
MTPSRYAHNCLCCGSADLAREWHAVSAFFARRALLRAPEGLALLQCRACGTRYFDIDPTGEELGRLYAGYRGEDYFRLRHGFEPWYTRAVNDGMGGEHAMRDRRAALHTALAECGVGDDFTAVLDHGGDRGQMLLELNAPVKAVYEISGVAPEPGVVAVDEAGLKAGQWDLILSCHVLEHLPDPPQYVGELARLGHEKTVYFFEVPNEAFCRLGFNQGKWQKAWVSWVVRHPSIFKLADFVSTGLRLKLGVVPPLCFVPVREHLTFFTVLGATRLLEGQGLRVLSAQVLASGHIGIVALK